VYAYIVTPPAAVTLIITDTQAGINPAADLQSGKMQK
jgi:hypothetical protein